MKDERVQREVERIYSELAKIILIGAAISFVIKFLILHKGLGACITEYVIMIGSPLYVRTRSFFRKVSLSPVKMSGKKKARIILLSSAVVMTAAIAGNVIREGRVDLMEMGAFLAAYLISFAIAFLAIQKLEEKQQEKLEEEYRD